MSIVDRRYLYYIGEDVGNNGSAMGIHTENIAQIFRTLGYSVIYISKCSDKNRDRDDDNLYFYTRNKVFPSNFINKYYRYVLRLTGTDIWKIFRKVSQRFTPSLIILYGYVPEKRLLKYSKKNNVPLLIDSTDWFAAEDRHGLLEKCIYQRLVDYAKRSMDLKASGVIAISDFLYEHYHGKVPVIRIPSLCCNEDDIELENTQSNSDILSLVYAGTPGNKDIIEPIISAVKKINAKEIRVRLNLVGELDSILMGELSKENNQNGIVGYGKVSHDKAIEIVKASDFSILLRHNRRYAKAGFSTKFSESMMMGVPVICNKVGGADLCITHMKDGLLLENCDESTIILMLEEILKMNRQEISQMKQNARDYAFCNFRYQCYVEEVKEFLAELV